MFSERFCYIVFMTNILVVPPLLFRVISGQSSALFSLYYYLLWAVTATVLVKSGNMKITLRPWRKNSC